ncbi:glycosyltransferase, partial [Patescibacteria group bacterium]|nr:glycosyltransferase [Patescibacteria group bacterium]
MKICTIAFRSIHTRKYLQWLVKRGHEVHWISEDPEAIDGVNLWDMRKAAAYFSFSSRLRRAGKQIGRVIYIWKALKQIRPDIFHLHTLYYPSFLGIFTGYHPLVISPWNGDVLWSKKRPYYHRYIVKQALKKADALTADNDIMKSGL